MVVQSAILLCALVFMFENQTMRKMKVEEDSRNNNGDGAGPSRSKEMEVREEMIPKPLLPLFPWEIKKILTGEDVGLGGALELSAEVVYSRIILHWDKKMAARVVYNGRRVPINIRDEDTGTDHTLVFSKQTWGDKFRIDTRWKQDFVVRRGLKNGMMIGMYWEIRSRSLRFSLLDDYSLY